MLHHIRVSSSKQLTNRNHDPDRSSTKDAHQAILSNLTVTAQFSQSPPPIIANKFWPTKHCIITGHQLSSPALIETPEAPRTSPRIRCQVAYYPSWNLQSLTAQNLLNHVIFCCFEVRRARVDWTSSIHQQQALKLHKNQNAHTKSEPTENKTKGGSCRERSTDPHGEPLVIFLLFYGADCSAAAVHGKLDLVYSE